MTSAPDPDFDARWSAWKARGVEHESAVRRRVTLAVPIFVVIAIVIYAFVRGLA